MDKAELEPQSIEESSSSSSSPKILQEKGHKTEVAESTEVAHYNMADPRPTNNGPFSFTPAELMDLIDPKSSEKLAAYGGVGGILAGLHTNPTKGLSTANQPLTSVVAGEEGHLNEKASTEAVSLATREEFFGKNFLPQRKQQSIFQLMWMALQEKILVSLQYLFLSVKPSFWGFVILGFMHPTLDLPCLMDPIFFSLSLSYTSHTYTSTTSTTTTTTTTTITTTTATSLTLTRAADRACACFFYYFFLPCSVSLCSWLIHTKHIKSTSLDRHRQRGLFFSFLPFPPFYYFRCHAKTMYSRLTRKLPYPLDSSLGRRYRLHWSGYL